MKYKHYLRDTTSPRKLEKDFFMTFLSLKNDVNVASKSTVMSEKNKKKFLVAILKVTDSGSGSESGSVNQRYGFRGQLLEGPV
jgi:hypothetical protein